MTLGRATSKRILVLDLLGNGRLERAIGRVADLLVPILERLGIACVVVRPSAHPRKTRSFEEALVVADDSDIEQAMRRTYRELMSLLAPDSWWRPAAQFCTYNVEQAFRLALIVRACQSEGRGVVHFVTRSGSCARLLSDLLGHSKVQGLPQVKLMTLLPQKRSAVKIHASASRRRPSAALPGPMDVLFVSQSRAIADTLEQVGTALRALSPTCKVSSLDGVELEELITRRRHGALLLESSRASTMAPAALMKYLDRSERASVEMAIPDVAAASELFIEWGLKVLVVGNDRFGLGSIAVAAARRAGIRTILVQDGVAADLPTWWSCGAEIVCASGAQLRDILVRAGRSQSDILVVGQPRRRTRVLAQASGAKVDDASTSVLVALQQHHGTQYCQTLFSMLRRVSTSRSTPLAVTVRLHPGCSDAVVELVSKQVARDRWSVDVETDLYVSLAIADLVVGEYSTVLVEAVLCGVPAASFEPSLLPPTLSLSKAGVSARFSSAAQLSQIVHDARSRDSSSFERYFAAARYLFGESDGTSSSRIAESILSLVSRESAGAVKRT